MSRYTCRDEHRRNAVAAHAVLNGIDYLEVVDREAPAGSKRQQTLLVRCLKPIPPLAVENVLITGGERLRNIGVEWVGPANAAPVAKTTPAERAFLSALPNASHVLAVGTASTGDFSTYTLALRRSATDGRPPAPFDPRMSTVAFSFKVECPTDFDCEPRVTCAEPPQSSPEIDYLAKDYGSFRRLMLDRIRQVAPEWRATTPADLGITLVELLAFAGDQLSYWQDAIATEAYLGTARRRTSLRRHVQLVDYVIHEGSNARSWLQLELAAGVPSAVIDLRHIQFLSRVSRIPARVPADPDSPTRRDAFAAQPVVFEARDPSGELWPEAPTPVTLHAVHHTMRIHTWGDDRCCLPRGATSATLVGHLDTLGVGDVVIFEEVKGPSTGSPADADPSHRHAVRVTSVRHTESGAALVDPLPAVPVDITEIEWARADGLPFPLCISSRTDEDHGASLIRDVSVARGNIVLADHGATISSEALGNMPAGRVHWTLAERPLTHAATVIKRVMSGAGPRTSRVAFDREAPASRALARGSALAVVRLTATEPIGSTVRWQAQPNLLDSESGDDHFVVETEHDGSATLRFGDDVHGRRPEPGTAFVARYRVGQGTAGNVGADTIAHVVSDDVRIAGVRNPLPARGGSEPENIEQIRRRAPQAFRTQERAATPLDYATVTERSDDVQHAAARQRWTGSWHTMFVAVDRENAEPMEDEDRTRLEAFIEPFRMAGHDVAVHEPAYVALEIALKVCVAPGHFRSDVHAELLDVLGNRDLPDGRRGLFHPDALTFGQPVYLSPIYAAARSVEGVDSVEVTSLARRGSSDDVKARHDGVMSLGHLEIARLDNDRSFPERGSLHITLAGGK